MGTPAACEPVQFFIGLLWSDRAARDRAVAAARDRWGESDSAWGPVPFDFTDYYVPEMGEGIRREFVAFHALRSPDLLAEDKLAANAIEAEVSGGAGLPRRVNVDPGFLDRYKLVLASTKNGPMRIPLGQGIYAEVTMTFRGGEFEPHRLTYRDYASDAIRTYFRDLREKYLGKLRDRPR